MQDIEPAWNSQEAVERFCNLPGSRGLSGLLETRVSTAGIHLKSRQDFP
jgi:hypothetical protein